MFKVEIVNRQTLHAYAGYGEGKTLAEAIADAMQRANRAKNADARYDEASRRVYFNGGTNS